MAFAKRVTFSILRNLLIDDNKSFLILQPYICSFFKKAICMKSIKSTLLFLSLLFIISSCSVKQPEFRGVENLKLDLKSTDEVKLNGDAIFFNPNKATFYINEINVKVFVDDKEISSLIDNETRKAEPNSEFRIPLDLRFPTSKLYDNVISGLFSLASGKKFEVKYDGYIRGKAFGISVKVPVRSSQRIKLKL